MNGGIPDNYVVLIPGLGAPPILMKPLGMRLKRAGYHPVCMTYPLHTPLEDHVERLKKLLHELNHGSPLNIVTHSYGSLICRNAYKDTTLPKPKRVVMIAPVNQGSSLAQSWYELTSKFPGGRRLMGILAGPVPFQIRNKIVGQDHRFPSCHGDVGVISLVLPWGLSSMHPLLKNTNDGTSEMRDTVASGFKDLIVLTGEHNSALLRRDVASKVIHFLDTGWFREY